MGDLEHRQQWPTDFACIDLQRPSPSDILTFAMMPTPSRLCATFPGNTARGLGRPGRATGSGKSTLVNLIVGLLEPLLATS